MFGLWRRDVRMDPFQATDHFRAMLSLGKRIRQSHVDPILSVVEFPTIER